MNLMSRIPKEFYKLFASKYTDYYMLFLAAIYEEMSLSYSVLGLTERECRAVMNEKIATATLLWDGENYDEEGIFLTRANMAQVCLRHFEEWGWLRQDYDETLNSYVVTFPEYSQMYVELFCKLFDESESEERESVMTIYSHLYTYHADKEKNNEILKSALRVSKKLVQMLVNMQDGMRSYFDELSKQKNFRGIQEVLVKEINNSDSKKYAILTTTDSFYRYKEAVKELLDQNFRENDSRRQQLRLERAIALCDEAANTLARIERQFDAIELRYNKLIEQKTIFANRAAARIRYMLQEGVAEDQTIAFVELLNRGNQKEAMLEALQARIRMSRPYRVMTADSLYQRRAKEKDVFTPVAVEMDEQTKDALDSFVLKPLYTQKELDEFREKNTVDGAFLTKKETVQTIEDLEKLFFIWQQATEHAHGTEEITVGEEELQVDGMRFSTLKIKEEQ